MSLSYWQLAVFYFVYFLLLGVLIPYLGPYLQALGYSGLAIGILTGMLSLTKVIAPNVWGYFLDHTPVRYWRWYLRLGAWMAVVTFVLLPWMEGFWAILAVIFWFSFFWNALLPQMETLVFQTIGARRYTQVRLWGSLGFMAAVLVFGWIFSESAHLLALPWWVLPGFVALALAVDFLPQAKEPSYQAPPRHAWQQAWRQQGLLWFFLAVILQQGSHGAYYSFFSLYLAEYGYAAWLIGLLWAFGVIAEIVLFILLPRWLPGLNLLTLMAWATALTALRWALLAALPEVLPMLFVIQFFHAASYALFHAAAIALIVRIFPDGARLRGQGLYSSLGYGFGVAMGGIIAGFFWDAGWAHLMYWGAALSALMAFGIVLGLRRSFATLAIFEKTS